MTTLDFNKAVMAFVFAYRAGNIENDSTHMDNAYDEWLEENLDKFEDDDSEVAFAQWKNSEGEKPRDCDDIDMVEAMWLEYKGRRKDGKDDEEGRWITTENKHKVHINEEGVADKGNPHVLAVMNEGEKSARNNSSPKGTAKHKIVNGKDISESYSGEGTITSVIHEQGFDGVPKVVSDDEFDEAVKASGFVAQRTYSSESPEVLDAYREALYSGEWYVECTYGKSAFGRGMYTVSDASGTITEAAEEEVAKYRKYGQHSYTETMTLAPGAKIADYRKIAEDWEDGFNHYNDLEEIKALENRAQEDIDKKIKGLGKRGKEYLDWAKPLEEAFYKEQFKVNWKDEKQIEEYNGRYKKFYEEKKRRLSMFDPDTALALDKPHKAAEKRFRELEKEKFKKGIELRKRFKDINAYAASLGYDAVNVPHGKGLFYTIILNRTKLIIKDKRNRKDDEDDKHITFRPGKDGQMLAVKDGKVIGSVWTNDVQSDDMQHDSDESSGPVESLGDKLRKFRMIRRKYRHDASFGDEPVDELIDDFGLGDDEEWITVNGTHILLNQEGKAVNGGDLAGKDFSNAKSEPTVARRPTPEVGKRKSTDFLPLHSYRDTETFKDAVASYKEASEKADELWAKRKELEEAVKSESRPKPKDEWDEEDEYQSLIGKRPRIYTEKGKKLQDELSKVEKEWFKQKKANDEASEKLDAMKEQEHQRQAAAYKPNKFKEAKKDDYEGFTLDKTSNSFGDEYLQNGKGRIVEMSPREYLERCAYEIFHNGTMESTMGAVDEKTTDKYAEQMKNGEKFDLPYLNYKDMGQEGRHRAVAAYKAGIETMPVLIIGDPKHRKDSKRHERMDEEPEEWITVNGNHIPLDGDKKPIGGQMKALGKAAPKAKARPAHGVVSKKTSLTPAQRKHYSDELERITEAFQKERDFQKSVNPKVKDYDPTPFIESEKRAKELRAEGERLCGEMPAGTIITKGTELYEKTDDGKWTMTKPGIRRTIENSSAADFIGGYTDNSSNYGPKLVESTDEAEQLEDISMHDNSTYGDWAADLNGKARKDLVKRAKKDPEFKELVDSIVLYTEGGYVDQRKALEAATETGLKDVDAQTVGMYANDTIYKIRDLWKGQDLTGSQASLAGGMAHLTGVINAADPVEKPLFRAAQDRSIAKTGEQEPYVPPKPGDVISITAPTSFTDSKDVETEISRGKMGDVIHYELEPGAKAVNVAELSRYKQSEYLTSGNFEVVSVDTETHPYPVFRDSDITPAIQKRGVKEDQWGNRYCERYVCTIKLRRVGDTNLTGKKDSEEEYLVYNGHFDERMVLSGVRGDAEPDSWITLKNGNHIPLDKSGKAIGGAGGWAEGKDFSGAKKKTNGTADSLTKRVKDAYGKPDYVEVASAFRKALKDMPVGASVKSGYYTYTKTGDNEYEYEWKPGQKTTVNENSVVNGQDFFDPEKAPVFKDPVGGPEDSHEVREPKERPSSNKAISIKPKLEHANSGSVVFDNNGNVYEKQEDGDYLSLGSGEILSAEELTDKGAELAEYTGKTSFEYGDVSPDVAQSRYEDLIKNQFRNEGKATLNSEEFESMVNSVLHYGTGGECQMILATQDPDAYADIPDMGLSGRYEEYAKEADRLEKFIELSNKYPGTIYRGMSFNDSIPGQKKVVEDLISNLKPGNEITMGHISSWSSNEGTARSYSLGAVDLELESGNNYSVIYECDNHKYATDLSGINPEGECIATKDARYRIRSVDYKYDESLECHVYKVKLEEI